MGSFRAEIVFLKHSSCDPLWSVREGDGACKCVSQRERGGGHLMQNKAGGGGRRGEKRGEEGERGIGLPNGMKAANEQQASEQLYC